MPSDLKFHKDSVGIWLRSEKVPSEFGNVVEVWRFEESHDLDPVVALTEYIRRHTLLFGNSDNKPVFVHEDGSNLSKSEFNVILKSLRDHHKEIASSVDVWSGHSFRQRVELYLFKLYSPSTVTNV